MDFHKIENKILSISPYVKEIAVVIRDSNPFAYIHPDFQALKKANIINIEEEIRWYGVELYNMEVEEDQKVRGYNIFIHPLPKTSSGDFDTTKMKELLLSQKEFDMSDEPDDKTYETLKAYISTLSDNEIYIDSHLELDIGLDSLDYVELFIFIEQTFGVEVDEVIFSDIMNFRELYTYVKDNQVSINPVSVSWEETLAEPIEEKLTYSPYIMYMYKTILFPLFKLYFRLEVRGKENIPPSPCIIAPTHQSMLDGFLIEGTLPYKVLKKTFFLAFKQVFGTTLLDPISKHGQSILIDANEHLKHTIQYTSLPLKEGNNLVIFPEGARTRDRKLLEFRPFFAMLSKTFNIPIVPVIIDGSYEALGTGKLLPRPRKVKLTYLEPISPENLNYHELTSRVKKAIENEIKNNPECTVIKEEV